MKTTKKKKSYYIPVSQRKTTKKVVNSVPKKTVKKAPKKVVKKKNKSYYKPKKKVLSEPTASTPVKGVPDFQSAAAKEIIPSKRPVKYLNNKDLLTQVLMSKKQGKMTNELAKMLQLLTSRYAKKGNFANYTYNDDMQSYAMLMIVKTWQGFDPAKSSNPFAWFTQCIKNSFIQYLNYEKRHRDVRDEILIEQGMSPSFGYSYDFDNDEKQMGMETSDHEVAEAPTKLVDDVDGFNSEPDAPTDDGGSQETY